MGRFAASMFDVAWGGILMGGIFLLFIITIIVFSLCIFAVTKIINIIKKDKEQNKNNRDA